MYFTASSLIHFSFPFLQCFASFWTLGANRDAYQHEAALELADKYNISPEGVSFFPVKNVPQSQP
jgi:hypothetical protein